MITQFVLDCGQHPDIRVGKFGDYFRLNYACRAEEWALCLRGLQAYTTNMECEALHKKFKSSPAYMDNKHNIRIDEVIKHLFVLNGQMIKRNIQCKNNITNKQTTSNFQSHMKAEFHHKQAIDMGDSLVCETADGWNVSSFETPGLVYQVTETLSNCPFADQRCLQSCYLCGACWHLMSCTCEYSENLNGRDHSCKHVHSVFM